MSEYNYIDEAGTEWYANRTTMADDLEHFKNKSEVLGQDLVAANNYIIKLEDENKRLKVTLDEALSGAEDMASLPIGDWARKLLIKNKLDLKEFGY